jgi:hypothetical protein
MSQPSPWILFMGGLALMQVSMMVLGLHAPAVVRYGGMASCIALGLVSIGLGLRRQFGKKPEKPRFVTKRERQKQKTGR